MADPVIHVQLELDPRCEPIEGALVVGTRPPEPFIGWIELAAALERLRAEAARPATV